MMMTAAVAAMLRATSGAGRRCCCARVSSRFAFTRSASMKGHLVSPCQKGMLHVEQAQFAVAA
jgi:hypothetical protein